MNVDDVGKLFTRNGEDVWRMIYACGEPTATFENIVTGEKIGGAIGCPNLKDFKRLVIKGSYEEKLG